MYVCVCYGCVCSSPSPCRFTHTHTLTHTHTHTHIDVAGADTAALVSHAVALSLPSPASRRLLVPQALAASHVSCPAPSAQSRVPPVEHLPHHAVYSIAHLKTRQEPPAQVRQVEHQDTVERGLGDDEDDEDFEDKEGVGNGEDRGGSGAGVEHGGRQVQAADVTEGDTASVTETKKVCCVCAFACPLCVTVI